MRILFVSKYVDHILYFCLRELAEKSELSIVYELESDWTARLAVSNVRVAQITAKSRFDRSFQSRIEELWIDANWDIVQSFHGNAQLANLLYWNKRKLPIVGYRAYIGHLKLRENPWAYWSVRSPKLAVVAAVSAAVKDYLDSFWLLKPKNTRVISHGINREWIASRCGEPIGLRAKLGLDEDTFVVASMAKLRPYKHFEVVAEAAKQLKSHPIHFVHLGNPKGWDERTRDIENIHFLGHQTRPFAIISEADVFATTSENEAFGRSNLEAMALGKPLIGSSTGGLLDLIDEGLTGRFFKTRDAADFARQVSAYYEDRSLVDEHRANALRHIDERFSSKRMAENYLKLYEDALSGSIG